MAAASVMHGAINLIQISDIHLFADPAKKLLDENTEQNFLQVLAAIQQNEKQIDAILMTGDLTDDGSVKAYQRMREYLNLLSCPIYFLPGNHDDLINIQQLVSSKIFAKNLVQFSHWELILLNSVVVGKTEGLLSAEQLNFLQQALATSDKFKLIALHHHPLPIRTKLFAEIDLKNREQFWQILQAAKNVKLVVSGHVHQAFAAHVGAIEFLTCPATSVQVNPESQALDHHHKDFVDPIGSGYRAIQLYDDGRFATQVKRVGDYV